MFSMWTVGRLKESKWRGIVGVGNVGGKSGLSEGACEGGVSSCFWAGDSHKENTITPICNVDLCNVDSIM